MHLRERGLSLVIPAYNEAAVVARAVAEAGFALSQLFERYEILVVDDGSTDGTAAEVEALLPYAPHTRLLKHSRNCGYGAALRTGFAAAKHDFVAFTDADCQFKLTELGPMADLARNVPIVTGYRVDRKDPWRRRFLSQGYNWLVRRLLGIRVRDCDCALKVFRREVLNSLLPKEQGFFVNTEMLAAARRLGHAVVEVPVTHRPRLAGTSKVSLREVPRTFRVLLGFWWRTVVRGVRPALVPANVVHARLTTSGRELDAAAPRPAGDLHLSSEPVPPAGRPGRHQEVA